MPKTLKPPHIVLAALAAGDEGARLDPVQIQHMLFLIDQKIPDWLDGPHFAFAPSPFGPFDTRVKALLLELCQAGCIHRHATDMGAQYYALTARGFAQGSEVLSDLKTVAAAYLRKLCTWVRSHGFRHRLSVFQLHYPNMIVGRDAITADQFRPDSARRRLVKDYLNHNSSQPFLMALTRMVNVSGTLDFHDRILRALTEARHESISLEDIWATVGDRLRKAMALYACDEPDPRPDPGEPRID